MPPGARAAAAAAPLMAAPLERGLQGGRCMWPAAIPARPPLRRLGRDTSVDERLRSPPPPPPPPPPLTGESIPLPCSCALVGEEAPMMTASPPLLRAGL